MRSLVGLLVASAILAASPLARAQGAGLPAYLQIVAHADDDFLFMNPDLGNQVSAGYESVTVFLTAGEAVGGAHGEDTQHFARARQRGALSAHAQMAGVANAWTRSVQSPDGVHQVEVYTLDAAPRIQLVFVGLCEFYDTLDSGAKLTGIWEDPAAIANTIVPACETNEACYSSPLPVQHYTRAGVLALLQALIATHQPTLVNAQDPQPWSDNGLVSYDHPDHIAGARFTDAALASYHGPFAARRYTLTHFKGYSFLDFPPDLGPSDNQEKRTTAEQFYRPYDSNYDATQIQLNSYEGYYHRQWERYPASTTWLERAADGRLVAATVEDRQVLTWHEGTPGGIWIGPIRIPSATPLAPHLSLIRRPDGLLQIFALRIPLERENWSNDQTVPKQEIVTAVQVAASSFVYFGPWTVVGTPDPSCTGFCQFAGVPAAAIDGSGRIFVFAKNSDGQVTYAVSSAGSWTPFSSFGAPDIVDGIAAQTRNDGRIEAFATSRAGTILHFIENSSTATMSPDTGFLPLSGVASAPTIAKNQDGRPEIFYREADTGRVLTVWDAGAGTYTGPTLLYGDAGVGPVAALLRPASGHIMLFERNVWQGISATWQQAPNDIFYLQWAILGGFLNEYPSAASDSAGRAVVAVKGGDGRLYYQRETAGIGSFADWAAIVGPCETFDPDMDGVCSTSDNCPTAANTGQQDADLNGVGDACECGDVDLTNVVGASDVNRIRGRLAGLPPGISATGLARCSVIGSSTDCDVRDLAVLRRALHTPPLGPGISRVCAAANAL
jgi:LmbE family N-acetylglucosaminyl deacetylase